MTTVEVNYDPFKFIIAKFNNEKISRERLIFDWREEQREQGIKSTKVIKCAK